MNHSEGFIKVIGSTIAGRATRCLKVIDVENIRLGSLREIENEKRRQAVVDRKEADRKRFANLQEYANSGQDKIDFNKIMSPYITEEIGHIGMFWWKRSYTYIKRHHSALNQSHKTIAANLKALYPDYWKHLPKEWWLEQDTEVLLRHITIKAIHELRPGYDQPRYPRPMRFYGIYTGSLRSLINLRGEVFLPISDYNHILEMEQLVVRIKRDDEDRINKIDTNPTENQFC